MMSSLPSWSPGFLHQRYEPDNWEYSRNSSRRHSCTRNDILCTRCLCANKYRSGANAVGPGNAYSAAAKKHT